MKRFSAILSLVFSVPALALLPGCGSGDGELTDEQQITALVSGLNDATGDQEAFAERFVSGSAPEDFEPYQSAAFTPSSPSISGDEATVPVKVRTGIVDSSQGDGAKAKSKAETFEVTWTLQKVSGDWKLKDAPISK